MPTRILLVLIFTGLYNTLSAQKSVRFSVGMGFFGFQNHYAFKHKALAPITFGAGLQLGETGNRLNLGLQYVRNRNIIEYPVSGYTFYRKEITDQVFLNMKWNVLRSRKFSPIVELNAVKTFAHIRQYSSPKDPAAPEVQTNSFSTSHAHLSAGIGAYIKFDRWTVEPVFRYALVKQHVYPFFLNRYFMVNLGYTLVRNKRSKDKPTGDSL